MTHRKRLIDPVTDASLVVAALFVLKAVANSIIGWLTLSSLKGLVRRFQKGRDETRPDQRVPPPQPD